MWSLLKGKFDGKYDFHRQKPLDRFIADFFCHELNLVIEIDGITHQWEETQIKDAAKEVRLNELGVNVLRFDDKEVLKHEASVLETIRTYIRCFETNDPSDLLYEDTPLNPLSRGDFQGANPQSGGGFRGDTIIHDFDGLYDVIGDKVSKQEANQLINSLKICDPAVGSGHFLVSALNEIIAIKSELKILMDKEGKTLRDYDISIENDELVITDDNDILFQYTVGSKEKQRVQETLFHEKQTLIENCLFGVDINPNSVKICRLRLWIELLKNAYYLHTPGPSQEGRYASNDYFPALQTLPNIDINIKCGNSLISRFDLDSDISEALKKSKGSAIRWDVNTYRNAVDSYKNATRKEDKREFERLIDSIKAEFVTEIGKKDKRLIKANKLKGELFNLTQQGLFELTGAKKKEWEKGVEKRTKELQKLEQELDEIKNNRIYENAFEWRFEFPEVLDDQGNFMGFDVVIGNPPYLTGSAFKQAQGYFREKYNCAEYQLDLYPLFMELSNMINKYSYYTALITPNSWLKNLKMTRTRRFVLDNTSMLSLNPNISSAFEEAQVDTLIFIWKNLRADTDILIWEFIDKQFTTKHRVKSESFKENEGNVFDVEVSPEIRMLLKKVRGKSISLDSCFEITRGVNPYNKYTGQSEEIIKSRAYHAEYIKDSTFVPELRGKHVSTFFYQWDQKHYISYGNWLAAPREERFYHGKRILFREIIGSRFICTLIEENFVNDRSLYVAKPHENTNTEFILGILASKLIIWLFRYEKNEFDDLFPKIRVAEFKKLPIPSSKNDNIEDKISSLVEDIIKIKVENNSIDTSELESQIDQLVYQLYGLTEEEIDLIEGSVNAGIK